MEHSLSSGVVAHDSISIAHDHGHFSLGKKRSQSFGSLTPLHQVYNYINPTKANYHRA